MTSSESIALSSMRPDTYPMQRSSGFIAIYAAILLLAAVLPFSVAMAASGECSNHGGVYCAAGPDWDGSVICNDGWRDSAVAYSSATECQNTSGLTCTPGQYNSLRAKYGIDGLAAQISGLKVESNSYSGGDSILSLQSANTNLINALTYKGKIDGLRSEMDALLVEIDRECQALGESAVSSKNIQTAAPAQSVSNSTPLVSTGKSQVKLSCPAHSYLQGVNCACAPGYAGDKDKCIPVADYCFKILGSYALAVGSSCTCKPEAHFDSQKNTCLKNFSENEAVSLRASSTGSESASTSGISLSLTGGSPKVSLLRRIFGWLFHR